MTAAIRPDSWNLPLLLHVGGAMLLVGSLVLVAGTLIAAARGPGPGGAAGLSRFGFRALLFAVLPSYILMRAGAQWIASEENVEDSDAAWIGIGFITSDGGFVLMVAATIVAGIAARRFERAGADARASRVAPALVLLLIAVYAVAVWAMATKPA